MLSKKSEGEGQILTFFSMASAVGKTVLAVNFAAALAERGFRVCLADLDLQFGDVCNYLALAPEQTLYDYSEANEATRNAAAFVTPTAFGFDVLAAPKELDEAFIMNAEIVSSAVNQLQAGYDFVILDTTTGFSAINLSLLELTDVLYLPCVVDFIPSIKNLKCGIDTLHKLQFDWQRVRLILNRNKAETQISVKDVEALLGRPFQYFIGNDYRGVTQSIKEGKPVVLTDKDSRLADEISNVISSELGEQEESGGFSKWFSGLWK